MFVSSVQKCLPRGGGGGWEEQVQIVPSAEPVMPKYLGISWGLENGAEIKRRAENYSCPSVRLEDKMVSGHVRNFRANYHSWEKLESLTTGEELEENSGQTAAVTSQTRGSAPKYSPLAPTPKQGADRAN